MTDQNDEQQDDLIADDLDQESTEPERREFLRSLGKWSQAVIGGVVAGGALTLSDPAEAGSWHNHSGGWGDRGNWGNRGGGSWGNRGGGSWGNRGGGSWGNRGGGWGNRGGGSWGNRSGGWYDRYYKDDNWYNRRPGWGNRGGSWGNRGGGSWGNRGGGWNNWGGWNRN